MATTHRTSLSGFRMRSSAPVYLFPEDSADQADPPSNNLHINHPSAHTSSTAPIAPTNSTLVHPQVAPDRPLGPNSVTFGLAHPRTPQQQVPSADAQLHAYQQMQLMQLETLRLQNAQHNQQHSPIGIAPVSSTPNELQPPPDLTPHLVRIKNQYSAGGSFGDVYRCHYFGGSVPTEVAVKAFRFNFTIEGDTSNRSVKMLRRELGIWRRLKHDNIVPFLGIAYGFGMDGTMSLVSLWMPNESLHKFLAKHDKSMGVVHRLQFLLDIANGLHYLHSIPVVHGDLNCNNVLLDAHCTARLADFGYASLVGNIPEALAYLQRSTVRPGALRWIAPEQIDPEETSTRTTKSDIYSFGCVCLQVLSGKQPWSEVREDAAVILRLAKGYKPDRPASREIDDLHWNLIQNCWSPTEERPAAETLVAIIRHFLSYHPPSRPLRDMLASWSGPVAESSTSVNSGSAEGSTTHVTHAAINGLDHVRSDFTNPLTRGGMWTQPDWDRLVEEVGFDPEQPSE